jgi:hypothetical protein
MSLPVTEYFSDYRLVEGLMIPFKSTTTIPTIGDVTSVIKTIKFDVDIPDATFHIPDKKK